MPSSEAPRTCEDPLIRSVLKYSCPMDVWEPARVRMSVGVTNVPPELSNFPAYVAMCHDILLTL